MNLQDLRGWMKGEDCIVVGCGPSVSDKQFDGRRPWQTYEEHWTIACNRSVRFASPDFAVCMEPKREAECWGVVRAANPLVVFSHQPSSPRTAPRIVQIESRDVMQWLDPVPPGETWEPLRISQSPFYAIALSAHLGFETIGVIGVDLTPDRFDQRALETSEKAYGRLRTVVEALGSRIVNLNPDSNLGALEKGPWSEVKTK